MTAHTAFRSDLEAAGAVFGKRAGREVAVSFGDVGDEVTTGRRAAGLIDLSHRSLLELTGPDRASFLQGQCTNEVKELVPGDGRSAFVLDNKGRNLALIRYLIDRERILLETGSAGDLIPRLEKFMVIEDVKIQDLSESHALLLLVGPGARPLLDGCLACDRLPDREDTFEIASLGSCTLTVRADRETGEEGFALWVPSEAAAEVWSALKAAGARPLGFDAYDVLRTEAGRPWHGRDFGADCLPEETGEKGRTVSYAKGCYVGQEQVSMQHFRGKPRKMICGILFESGSPRPGDPVLIDGKQAGTLGSVHASPTLSLTIALALLKGVQEPGTLLTVAPGDGGDEIPGSVCSLPFVNSSA